MKINLKKKKEKRNSTQCNFRIIKPTNIAKVETANVYLNKRVQYLMTIF